MRKRQKAVQNAVNLYKKQTLDVQAADLVKILAPHIQPSRVVAQAALKHAAPSLTTAHLELLNSCMTDHLRQHTKILQGSGFVHCMTNQ